MVRAWACIAGDPMRAVLYLAARELRGRWRAGRYSLCWSPPPGRWAVFVHGLGIPPAAITPVWPVLFTVPAVIVIANAVAIWPGQATARRQPAEVLRVE
jgi:hypothetical protein